ncbi:MAG: hypothetical protein QOI24_816 [Acidobacteriota bacterium]|nr:hypothetical protein [Acidobacteriota bacterium]
MSEESTIAGRNDVAERRRHDALALGILALLGTIFFADVLFGFNQFYMRDLTRYYYPTKQILREIVQHGEFPYWNRYYSAGQPIAANPEHEVFYPLTWLILLPSYDFGYRLHILIHVYIGLLGMYALLRSMELRAFAAFAGALAFGLGGLYLSYINLLPILFCAAWLPLTCLYARRFLLHRTLRNFALASFFLGLQFLVGEPTTIAQTGFLLGLYALYRGWYSTPRLSKMFTRVFWIGAISSVALLVGAAQIIPAIDHVRDSARSRPFDFDLVSAWSMPWAKFAEMIFPNILGHISVKQVMWYWAGGLYTGMGSPFIFNIYAGLLVITLAAGAIFVRPRGGRFVLIVIFLSSLFALGGHTPLLKLLYDAHLVTSLRYPEKFILFGIFALIIFSSQMLDRILGGDDELRDGALGFVFAVSVVAITFAILSFTPMYTRVMMKIWGMPAGVGTTMIISLMRTDWIVAAVRGVLLVALLWSIRIVPRKAWYVAATLFIALDLGLVVHELNPRMPRRFFDPPPAASQFPKERAQFRIFHEADWYGTEEIARKYFSTGDAVYWVVRNGLYPMTPAGSQLRTVLERDYDKTALIPTIVLTDSIWDVKRSGRADWYVPFMAMSNAWYRGVFRDFPTEKKRNGGNFKESRPIDFIEGEHYARYYFADQVVTIRDRHEFVSHLSHSTWSAKTAFVMHYPSFVPARGEVRSVRETANTATLDVVSHGQGLLVMSITPHKYWHISVDGKPSQSILTNIGYQSIIITPGHHTVTMRYRNELVLIGLGITLTMLTLLVLTIVFARRGYPPVAPAYEETLHVVADAQGTHVEPVEPLLPPEPAENAPDVIEQPAEMPGPEDEAR